jgi:hypothetical protein
MNAETQKTDVYKFDGLDDAIVGIGSQALRTLLRPSSRA